MLKTKTKDMVISLREPQNRPIPPIVLDNQAVARVDTFLGSSLEYSSPLTWNGMHTFSSCWRRLSQLRVHYLSVAKRAQLPPEVLTQALYKWPSSDQCWNMILLSGPDFQNTWSRNWNVYREGAAASLGDQLIPSLLWRRGERRPLWENSTDYWEKGPVQWSRACLQIQVATT